MDVTKELDRPRAGSRSGPGPLVRRALAADAEHIAMVLARAFEPYRARYTEEAYRATIGTPDRARARLSDGQSWVAVLDGRIVGTTSAARSADGALLLQGMAVEPGARRRGCGWRLLETAERFAWSLRLERLRLKTTPFLFDAIRLYERYGFVRSREGPLELHGTPLFTMQKSVSAFPCDPEDDA